MLYDPRTDHKTAFSRNGFIGPIPFLTRQQASFLTRHLHAFPRDRLRWEKSMAAFDPLTCEIASNPDLLHLVRDLIGDDVVLWGGSLVVKKPGEIHPWHCDAESCAPEGGFVSVWVGLLNTRKESGLCMIPSSHTYGVSIQEAAARERIARKDRNDDVALRLASARQPGVEIVQPDVSDGDAVLFDGRIWHGSRNDLSDTPRAALLLQYAKADLRCRVPEIFEWPFRFNEQNRPPVIVVSGRGDHDKNELVAAPAMREPNPLGTCVHYIDPNSRCPDGNSFMPVHCFQGYTDNVDYLECHYSVLMPGASPHLPHKHVDEEILVVMSGAAELVIADSPRDPDPKIMPATAGSAAYYPPFQHHTIRNVSSEPVRYAMLRWKSPAISAEKHLPTRFVQPGWLRVESRRPIVMHGLFEGPSAFLGKLHGHVTQIAPAGGYAAHRDEHDVSIFLIEGEISILGKRIVAPTVVFIPAGHLHDMKAVGAQPAKYMVWEFHRTEPGHAHGRISVSAQEPDAILAQ